MAVSKVAIMALVGILAVPILLGYALNLEEVADTDYKLDGEAVNVTPLLQNGATYTLAHADVYKLNTNFPNGTSVYYEDVGSTATSYYIDNSTQTGYVNFAAGFHYYTDTPGYTYAGMMYLPLNTRSTLITINLDSVNVSDYSFRVVSRSFNNHLIFTKTTIDNEVNWHVELYGSGSPQEYDIYYDPARSDNTYQLKISHEDLQPVNGYPNFRTTFDLRYVGGWPALIGAANYYQQYTMINSTLNQTPTISDILDIQRISGTGEAITRSNTIRIDDALFNAMEYAIIADQEYIPADFKTNPSTKISDITKYGESITFAGTTYTVGSDGNIMLGTHKVSINGIVFDSVPVAVGYENRINGTVINVSTDPATITFNGQWSASISTTAQTATTYTKTEWIAGEFAWDGLDTNFLLVGLITSLGMFIALGIYSRRSRTSLWPLMIVCGCAAALFFIMI